MFFESSDGAKQKNHTDTVQFVESPFISVKLNDEYTHGKVCHSCANNPPG